MRVKVCGPNITYRHGLTFEVHEASCEALRIGKARLDPHPLEMVAKSRDEVCDAVYSPEEFDCQSGDYVYDFHFAPCCAALAR